MCLVDGSFSIFEQFVFLLWRFPTPNDHRFTLLHLRGDRWVSTRSIRRKPRLDSQEVAAIRGQKKSEGKGDLLICFSVCFLIFLAVLKGHLRFFVIFLGFVLANPRRFASPKVSANVFVLLVIVFQEFDRLEVADFW